MSAYDEARKRIESCQQAGKLGTVLDLTGFGLSTLPPEIVRFSVAAGDTTCPIDAPGSHRRPEVNANKSQQFGITSARKISLPHAISDRTQPCLSLAPRAFYSRLLSLLPLRPC